MEMTLPMPPMVETWKTPESIIGHDNLPIFVEHYQIATSAANGGEFPDKRLNKEIGQDVRQKIAEVYETLRETGFVPSGVNGDGSIRWSTVLKSKLQVEFERGLGDLEGLSMDQLKDHVIKSGFLIGGDK